ncbi:MAG: CPBP family intramembrane metalloprotease [Candidatus Omnitrophica bacterium]|nr:CPBP family intramembrane metalloprotease [Candidatus Omnitrophota bacterium]
MPAKVRREPVHLFMVVLAFTLLSFSWISSEIPDPWKEDQKQSALRLEETAAQINSKEIQEKLAGHPVLALVLLLWTWSGLGILAAGSAALWRTLKRMRRGEKPLGQWFYVPQARWGIWEVVKILSWLVVTTQMLYLMQHFLSRATHRSLDRHTAAAIHTLLLDALAVGFIALFIVRPFRVSWQDFGLRFQAWSRQLTAGIFGYVIWIPVLTATFMAMMVFYEAMNVRPQPQSVVVMLLNETRPRLLLLLSFLVAGAGPIAEEIVFRGMAYGALRKYTGVRWGIVLSALLFAGLHFDVMSFVPIAVLGAMLAWLYEQTGSLIPSMVVHMIHNSVMLGMTLTMRELFRILGPGA